MTEIEWKATREQVETLVEQTIRRMIGEKRMSVDDLDLSARQARAVEAAIETAERFFLISRSMILSRGDVIPKSFWARATIAYVLRHVAHMPLKKIAAALNREDHSTVSHMLKRFEDEGQKMLLLVAALIMEKSVARAMKDEGEAGDA